MPAADDRDHRRAKLDELAERADRNSPLFRERPNVEPCTCPADERLPVRQRKRSGTVKHPPAEAAPDVAKALADVRNVADAFFGEHSGGEFVVHTAEGRDVTIPIPARVPAPPPGPPGLVEFLALARAAAAAGTPASCQAVAGGLRFRFDVVRVDASGDVTEGLSDA
jgi:hypothetical protein